MKLIPLLIFLCGCTPYLGYRHVDATPAQGGDDAWDLACGGLKASDGRWHGRFEGCKNIRGGGLLEIGVDYDLIGD